jgi:hypothetical protein
MFLKNFNCIVLFSFVLQTTYIHLFLFVLFHNKKNLSFFVMITLVPSPSSLWSFYLIYLKCFSKVKSFNKEQSSTFKVVISEAQNWRLLAKKSNAACKLKFVLHWGKNCLCIKWSSEMYTILKIILWRLTFPYNLKWKNIKEQKEGSSLQKYSYVGWLKSVIHERCLSQGVLNLKLGKMREIDSKWR